MLIYHTAGMHVLFRCIATNIRDCDLICSHLSARDISMRLIISVAVIVSVLGPWVEAYGHATQTNKHFLVVIINAGSHVPCWSWRTDQVPQMYSHSLLLIIGKYSSINIS